MEEETKKFSFIPVVINSMTEEVVKEFSEGTSDIYGVQFWVFPYNGIYTNIGYKTSENNLLFPLFRGSGWEKRIKKVSYNGEGDKSLYVRALPGSVIFFSVPNEVTVEELNFL